MAKQTTLPQKPTKTAPVGQQILTTWTMLLYFINAIYDAQIASILAQIAAIGGTSTVQAGSTTVTVGNTTVTVVHTLGAPNAVNVTPTNANIATVWGGGGYWITGKTNTQFVINLAVAAPAGGVTFDWMVKTT